MGVGCSVFFRIDQAEVLMSPESNLSYQGGARSATTPLLPDLSCTTIANGQSFQARGASFPGKVLWESAPLMYMHGGRTNMHASLQLQERTCAV